MLDEGPGIDPAERERVFERFFRGEASRGGAPGTGLGLSVVEALAERWGGSVELASRPEGGTRAERGAAAGDRPANRALTRSLTTLYPGGASLESMRIRTAAVVAALAIFGLGAAVGIGLAANSISGDSVGLSAEPLSAGEALAPTTREDRADEARAASAARERAAGAERRARRAGAGRPATADRHRHRAHRDRAHRGRRRRGRRRRRSGSRARARPLGRRLGLSDDSDSSGSGSDDSGSDDNSGHGGDDD